MGMFPYGGLILSCFFLIESAEVEICFNNILLHICITLVAGKGSPYS